MLKILNKNTNLFTVGLELPYDLDSPVLSPHIALFLFMILIFKLSKGNKCVTHYSPHLMIN